MGEECRCGNDTAHGHAGARKPSRARGGWVRLTQGPSGGPAVRWADGELVALLEEHDHVFVVAAAVRAADFDDPAGLARCRNRSCNGFSLHRFLLTEVESYSYSASRAGANESRVSAGWLAAEELPVAFFIRRR